MFSIIGITGRVGGGAASRLLEMGKQVRAVVRDEAKGHVWASKGASVAVADMTDGDGLGRAIAGSEAVFVMLPPLFDPSAGFPEAKGLIDSLSAALRQSKAKRIVALSTIGAQVTRPNLLNGLHIMEESFRQLPMPVTFLRPGCDPAVPMRDGVRLHQQPDFLRPRLRGSDHTWLSWNGTRGRCHPRPSLLI
jgi:uncharacterized protein YbjT (DUF2867 family)